MRVIFPCSYLHPTQVDEDLVNEYVGIRIRRLSRRNRPRN